MTKEIQLTQGKVAIVDDEDFDLLNQWKWYTTNAGYVASWEYLGKDESGKYIKKAVLMHRLLLNCQKGYVVDHIDGNPLNNTRNNLRICEHRQNIRNMNKKQSGKSSKYKGVCFDKITGRFQAYVNYNYKKIHLGRFLSEEDAAIAYNKKAEELFGEYASLNILCEGEVSDE